MLTNLFGSSMGSPMPLAPLHGSGGNERELTPLAGDLAPGSAILAGGGGISFDGKFAFFHRRPDRSNHNGSGFAPDAPDGQEWTDQFLLGRLFLYN